jgi:hypothetical protein
MNVSFKNMSNKSTTIQVDYNDTLESVVSKLMEQNGIDSEKNNINPYKIRVNSPAWQSFIINR